MHGVETPEHLVVTSAIHSDFKLFERASIGIGELVRAGDSRVLTDSNGRTSLLWMFRKLSLARGQNNGTMRHRAIHHRPAADLVAGKPRFAVRAPRARVLVKIEVDLGTDFLEV